MISVWQRFLAAGATHLSRALLGSLVVGLLCPSARAAERHTRSPVADRPKRYQTITTSTPPAAPSLFNPDPGHTFPFPPDLWFSGLEVLLEPKITLTFEPPQSPAVFNPDPANPPLAFIDRTERLERILSLSLEAPAAPVQFNPDPGAMLRPPAMDEPFFRNELTLARPPEWTPIEGPLALPRQPVRHSELQPVFPPAQPFGAEPLPPELQLPRSPVRLVEMPSPETTREPFGAEALPPELELPRANTRRNLPFDPHFANDGIPHSPDTPLPPHTEAAPDRWRVGFTPWRRYTGGSVETPYSRARPHLWHPYQQSVLKGDLPVIGQNIFLNITALDILEVEAKRVPTPSGISAARPGQAEFFGRSEQITIQNNFGIRLDLFQGETAFKPVDWAVRLQPVFNVNYLNTRETGVVSPDPRGRLGGGSNNTPPDNSGVINPGDLDDLLEGNLGAAGDLTGKRHTVRTRDHFALQEAFVELHLRDLSDNYDFVAARGGIQTFISDFRGLLFNDSNLGLRFLGSARNNRLQYNVAGFHLLEKDTNSELNTFDARDQQVLVANLFWQDFFAKGYTALWSFHANLDHARTHYDRNGNVVRPAPLGTVEPHDVTAYYLGWGGDGHIGRLNLSHQFYYAFGRDELNGLAGRPVDISALFGALELSYDRDWLRYKASFVYASGDDDAEDGRGRGFDTIVDNANFTGGPFSYYVRQGFNLAGTGVNLKDRNSLVPNLRTSKTQGQANFVNPGVFIYSLGLEAEITPKLKGFFNANYLRFAETDPIKTALLTSEVHEEIGLDLSLGFQYRPFLTDNIIISAGFGALLPGRGYKDIYRRNTDPVPGFNRSGDAGKADDFLYSGLIAIILTY